MDILSSILTGNIGTAIIALILWRSGLLKELLNIKNGNGKDTKKIAEDVAEVLSTNHLHKVIENSDKSVVLLQEILDEVKEHSRSEIPLLNEITKGIAIIQAKQNGKQN